MPKLFLPLLREPAKHAYRLLNEPAYRQLCRLTTRLGNTPRFTRVEVQVGPWKLIVPDVASFLSTYEAIFVDQMYDFAGPADGRPYILDCGANIGLSALFFKSRFPQGQILAFEPDPQIARIFRQNVHGNGFADVTLIEKALWTSETTLSFSSEGADAGRIDVGGDANLIPVQTVRLRDHLNGRPIDFLKVDIEGAEVEVMADCADRLGGVARVFVEYHSFTRKPQQLGRLLSAIESAGFRVRVQAPAPLRRPLLYPPADDVPMDLQLNLFGYRPAHARKDG